MTSLIAIVLIGLLVGLAAMAGQAARRGLDGAIAERQPLVLVLAPSRVGDAVSGDHGVDEGNAMSGAVGAGVRRRALQVLRRLAGRQLLGEAFVVADGASGHQRMVGMEASGRRGEAGRAHQLTVELLEGGGPDGHCRLRPSADQLVVPDWAMEGAHEGGEPDDDAELWSWLLGCGIVDLDVPKIVAPAFLRPRGSLEARAGRAGANHDRIVVAGWIDRACLAEFAGVAGHGSGGWRELAEQTELAHEAVAASGERSGAGPVPGYLLAWARLRASLDAGREPRAKGAGAQDEAQAALAQLQSAIAAGEDDWPSALAGIAHLNCAGARAMLAGGRRRYVDLLAARAHLREAIGRLEDAAIEGEWLVPGTEDAARTALARLEALLSELEGPLPVPDRETDREPAGVATLMEAVGLRCARPLEASQNAVDEAPYVMLAGRLERRDTAEPDEHG